MQVPRYLLVEVIGDNGFLPFVVTRVLNDGFRYYHYGPVPVGDGTIDGASIDAATGRIVPRWLGPFKFANKLLPADMQEDMWYHDRPDKLFHVFVDVRPPWLKLLLRVPSETWAVSFRGLLAPDPAQPYGGVPFGYGVGSLEVVYLAQMTASYVVVNETSFRARTDVSFRYAEYEVRPVTDSEKIYRMLVGDLPGLYKYTLGGTSLGNRVWAAYGFGPLRVSLWADKATIMTQIRDWVAQVRR